jgi:hypothetical protein
VPYVRRSAAAAALLITGLSVAGTPMASGVMRHRTPPELVSAVSIPEGWHSYSYRGVMISVPMRWAVKHNTNCPNTSAPGALLLGYPRTLEFCADYQYTNDYVAVYASPVATTATGESIKVNGLTVDVGFGSSAQLEWNIPSLGLQVTAGGSQGKRIVRTLRRS